MPDDEKTTDQLKRIIQLLQTTDGKSALQAIIVQNATIITNQELANEKLDQIIANTAQTPDTDISSLGGSISTPKKQ